MAKPEPDRFQRCQLPLFPNTTHTDGPPYDQIVELYNDRCVRLPPCKILSDRRKRSLRVRWREDLKRQNLDWWRKYFEYINSVDFLCGINDYKWSADFDFVIKPSKMARIIEGSYEN